MGMCKKCKKVVGILFLLVGIVFLLKDWNVWTFFGIQWYSALFLLWGITFMGKSCCKDCNTSCCETPEKKKKK